MDDSYKQLLSYYMIGLVAVAVLVLCLPLLPSALTIRDKENKIIWAKGVAGEGFTVSFTHSANKGQVTESYRFLEHNKFTLSEGTFESYGAGMLDQLPNNVTMEDNGDNLLLHFPEQPVGELDIIPGEIASQVLVGNGYSVNLSQISAYEQIKISRENMTLLQLFLVNALNTSH